MSSSSSRRGFHVRRHPVVVDIGCSCRRPKLPSLLNFSLSRGKHSGSSSSSRSSDPFSPSTSLTTTITNSSFSPSVDDTSSTSLSYVASPSKNKMKTKNKNKKNKAVLVEESVAIEKVSSDPYLDFKDSMLQMIVEKEIYQWEELRELLHLFLSLNAPYHHHLIITAFTEIWNGVFSPSAAQ